MGSLPEHLFWQGPTRFFKSREDLEQPRNVPPPLILYRSQFSHVNSYSHFEYVVMQNSSLPMVGLVVFFAWKIM